MDWDRRARLLEAADRVDAMAGWARASGLGSAVVDWYAQRAAQIRARVPAEESSVAEPGAAGAT